MQNDKINGRLNSYYHDFYPSSALLITIVHFKKF